MAGRMGRLAEPGPDGSEDCIADGGTHTGRRRLAEADGNLFAINKLSMPYSDPKGQRPRPAPARRLDPPRCRRPRRSSVSQPSPHRCRGRTRKTRATQAIQVGISRSCPNVVAMPSPRVLRHVGSPACLLRRTLDDRRLVLRSTDGVRGRTRALPPAPSNRRTRKARCGAGANAGGGEASAAFRRRGPSRPPTRSLSDSASSCATPTARRCTAVAPSPQVTTSRVMTCAKRH